MSNERENITFTPALRDSLRESYDGAVDRKDDTFHWHGKAFVTSYAKYLLQHLDTQFNG